MNNLHHQEMVKTATQAKFGGKQNLVSRSVPHYPDSAEREFQRLTGRYMRLLNKTLKEHLPAMITAYKKVMHGDSRYDDVNDFGKDIRKEMSEVTAELEAKIAEYGIEEFIEKIGRMARNKSLSEWKRVVHDTLGIDLLDDYYNGDFYARALKQWVDENVLKIKSIPNDTLGKMQDIILNGYKQGMSIRDLTKAIQEEYRVTKHYAAMLARDQIATLNSQISRMQQEDAGVSKYRWSDSRDSRVRDCHRELNGKIFSWKEPPEMWYETKSRGRVYTGRRCHPGEDYCCRCVAIPIFDKEMLNIPIKPPDEQK